MGSAKNGATRNAVYIINALLCVLYYNLSMQSLQGQLFRLAHNSVASTVAILIYTTFVHSSDVHLLLSVTVCGSPRLSGTR